MNPKERRVLVVFVIVTAVVAGGIAGFLFRPVGCGSNEECFNALAKECKRATVSVIKEGIQYEYRTKGSGLFDDDCKLDVKVRKVISNNPEVIRSFSGTEMSCVIPKESIVELTKNDQILKFCHGTLKEALYELTINRLYTLVLGDLGGLIAEAGKIIKEK